LFTVLDTTVSTTYVATGLNAGTIYEFKLEARNEYGYSSYSTEVTLLCAYIPEIPTNVVTAVDGA
jgi:hypothetical protein